MNERNRIAVSVVTPLSVGKGNEGVWKPGVDYVYNRGKIYHLSLERMAAAGMDMGQIAALLAASNEEGLLKLLGDKLEQVVFISFKIILR